MGGFAQFFVDGGPWMIPIAAVSVPVVAICIERLYALFFVYNTNGGALWDKVQGAIRSNQDQEAIRVCDSAGKAALAQVLKKGISRNSWGPDEVASGIDEATLEVAPKIQKRTGSLAGLASLATLLGLLGTIVGLIDAFRAVAEAPMDQKSILLTKAISVAMNTTAFGLMVAIPATLVYMFLMNTTKKIMDDMDQYSVKLENLLRNRGKA